MRVFNRKSVTVVATGTLVMAGAGVAFAFWTASGEGTGSASTSAGEAQLSIVQTSTISDLRPGGAPQAITGDVKNTSTTGESAYVTSVTVSVVGTDKADCDASNYSIADGVMDVTEDLSANEVANFGGATLVFVNKATNQDACKGATVKLAYAAA